MGALPKLEEWIALRKEREAFGGELKDFCQHKSISYTYTSKKFAAMDREEEETAIAKARRILAKAGPVTAQGLVELTASTDLTIRLKAIDNLLNKIGLSPQVAAVQINNSNSLNAERVQVQFFLPDNGRQVLDVKTIDNLKLPENTND